MTRQGAADTISGAAPIAVSQSQPSASPLPPRASPATARTRRSPIHDRTIAPGKNAVGQHAATVGPGASSGACGDGTRAGFVISNLFMTLILLDSKNSAEPCQNRRGVEQPV